MWGDPDDVLPITLEGNSFPVTRNLHSALTNLRCDSQKRVLWVDALCINQGDLDERTSQVTQMRYIYGLASTVVVFLGDAWPGSDVALDFVEQIGEDPTLHIDQSVTPHVVSHGMDTTSEDLQASLIRFFVRPSSAGAACWTGTSSTSASAIVTRTQLPPAVNTPWNSGSTTSPASACGMPWTERRRCRCSVPSPRESFLNIATTFRTRKSFDPRDKIYGILGLATGEFAKVLPDYNRQAEEAFEHTFLLSVEQTRSLDALSYVYGESDPDLGLGLPSFVLDWTAAVHVAWHHAYESLHSDLSFRRCAGDPSGVEGHPARRGDDEGRICGRYRGSRALDYQDWKQMVDECRRLQSSTLADEVDVPYPSRAAAFWQTMCGGVVPFTDEFGLHFRRVDETDYPVYQRWQAWVDSVLSPALVVDGLMISKCRSTRLSLVGDSSSQKKGTSDSHLKSPQKEI